MKERFLPFLAMTLVMACLSAPDNIDDKVLADYRKIVDACFDGINAAVQVGTGPKDAATKIWTENYSTLEKAVYSDLRTQGKFSLSIDDFALTVSRETLYYHVWLTGPTYSYAETFPTYRYSSGEDYNHWRNTESPFGTITATLRGTYAVSVSSPVNGGWVGGDDQSTHKGACNVSVGFFKYEENSYEGEVDGTPLPVIHLDAKKACRGSSCETWDSLSKSDRELRDTLSGMRRAGLYGFAFPVKFRELLKLSED